MKGYEAMNSADQARAMGLQVGDTIEGTESDGEIARLTLLWIGNDVAVFRVTELRTRGEGWSEPEESADWDLSCREWRKVDPLRG